MCCISTCVHLKLTCLCSCSTILILSMVYVVGNILVSISAIPIVRGVDM